MYTKVNINNNCNSIKGVIVTFNEEQRQKQEEVKAK